MALGGIIGGVLGFVILICIAVIWYLVKRGRKMAETNSCKEEVGGRTESDRTSLVSETETETGGRVQDQSCHNVSTD
jgi:hypothetical protein